MLVPFKHSAFDTATIYPSFSDRKLRYSYQNVQTEEFKWTNQCNNFEPTLPKADQVLYYLLIVHKEKV